MAWLRLDDGFSQHPKIVRLSRADRWTWLEVLCYCARFKTHGAVPEGVGDVVKGASSAFLERCRSAGLLDGEIVHDWNDYNGRDPKIVQNERQRKRRDIAVTDDVTTPLQERDENVTRAQARGRVPVPNPITATAPNGSVAAASRDQHAGDVLAAVSEAFTAKGIPISTRHRGILGKQARELIDSGFEFDAVVLACVTALRRGEPQNVHFIAGDLVTAKAGQRLTRREYERALQDEMELGRD